jgi:Arc/MetJ family transcription regulator
MGKTTVVIDDKLLEKAVASINAKTKREAIEAGLRELIRKKNITLLREEFGTYKIDLDLKKLEKLRSDE